MRFMIIVKATKDSEAGVRPSEELFAAMADYHEQLVKAGVLLDASGLQPTSKGWRVKYSGGKRSRGDVPSPPPPGRPTERAARSKSASCSSSRTSARARRSTASRRWASGSDDRRPRDPQNSSATKLIEIQR